MASESKIPRLDIDNGDDGDLSGTQQPDSQFPG